MYEIQGNVEGTNQIIYVGTTDNLCVICGEIVPEGRECCFSCEMGILNGNK